MGCSADVIIPVVVHKKRKYVIMLQQSRGAEAGLFCSTELHVSFVRNRQTRAPFLLQERDPISAHTFELGAQGFEWL